MLISLTLPSQNIINKQLQSIHYGLIVLAAASPTEWDLTDEAIVGNTTVVEVHLVVHGGTLAGWMTLCKVMKFDHVFYPRIHSDELLSLDV